MIVLFGLGIIQYKWKQNRKFYLNGINILISNILVGYLFLEMYFNLKKEHDIKFNGQKLLTINKYMDVLEKHYILFCRKL
jgi:hypothetical protein